MSTLNTSREIVRRSVCLIMAVFIVCSGLSLGALGAQALERSAIAAAAARA